MPEAEENEFLQIKGSSVMNQSIDTRKKMNDEGKENKVVPQMTYNNFNLNPEKGLQLNAQRPKNQLAMNDQQTQ